MHLHSEGHVDIMMSFSLSLSLQRTRGGVVVCPHQGEPSHTYVRDGRHLLCQGWSCACMRLVGAGKVTVGRSCQGRRGPPGRRHYLSGQRRVGEKEAFSRRMEEVQDRRGPSEEEDWLGEGAQSQGRRLSIDIEEGLAAQGEKIAAEKWQPDMLA